MSGIWAGILLINYTLVGYRIEHLDTLILITVKAEYGHICVGNTLEAYNPAQLVAFIVTTEY